MNPANLNVALASTTLEPLTCFIAGVAVYAIFVFNIYRFIGRRDIFDLNLKKYETSKNRSLSTLLYPIFYEGKYLVLFTFLAKSRSLGPRLLVSMVVLAAIEVIAFLIRTSPGTFRKCCP